MWLAVLLAGVTAVLAAETETALGAETAALKVELPPSAYRHQDSDFGVIVKRYLRRVLLPSGTQLGDGAPFGDGTHKTLDNVYYDSLGDGESSALGDRHLRVSASSYYDPAAASPSPRWDDATLRDGQIADPDFWDIVAWLGTQLGRGIRTLFNGICKLCRAIYAGVLYGWNTEGAAGMSATTTPAPTA